MKTTTVLCCTAAQRAAWTALPLLMCAQMQASSPGIAPPAWPGHARSAESTLAGDTLSSAPHLLFPPDSGLHVSHRPRFCWHPVDGASGYLLEIVSDSISGALFAVDSVRMDTVFRPRTPLAPDQRYVYRIRALNGTQAGPWSDLRIFTTSSPPLPDTRILAFPPTRRGTASLLTITLRGSAVDTLNVDSIHTGSTAFHAAYDLDPTPGERDTVRMSVEFTPDRFGFHADTLMVHTSEGTSSVLLLGTSPPPVLSAMTRMLSLGPVAIEDTATGYITIHNRGNVNELTILNMFHFSGAFLSPGPGLLRIPPEDSLVLQVRFTAAAFRPKAFGVHVDTLVIDSNGGIIKLPLRGESPLPVMNPIARKVSFSPAGIADSSIAFLRVTNPSLNTLEIDTLFTRSGTYLPLLGSSVVRSRDTVSIPLRFLPRRFGLHADTLIMRAHARPATAVIPLVGFCPVPVPVPSPPSLSFGAVEAHTQSRLTLALGNSSLSVLRVDSMTTKTKCFGVARLPEFGTLRLGDSLHVSVTFSPDTTGGFVDTLLVFNSSPASPSVIPLTGTGIPNTDVATRDTGIPDECELGQNYPNPFNGTTTIRFGLPVRSQIRLWVFNSIGQELALLAEGELPAGYHEATWRTDAASGVYFCRLEAVPSTVSEQRVVRTRKMILIR